MTNESTCLKLMTLDKSPTARLVSRVKRNWKKNPRERWGRLVWQLTSNSRLIDFPFVNEKRRRRRRWRKIPSVHSELLEYQSSSLLFFPLLCSWPRQEHIFLFSPLSNLYDEVLPWEKNDECVRFDIITKVTCRMTE